MIRRLVGQALDALLGPRCSLGCGQRVFPRDVQRHFYLDHGGMKW